MNTKLFKTIQQGLFNLGISKGDDLIVHSSLSALGKIPDKAQVITSILLDTLGEEGTLLMPALSYESVTRDNPFFSQQSTPSCVGWLTEYFRNLPGVRRSIHPTHSVCAIGRRSSYYLNDHLLDHTPCGRNSPFRKLKEAGGKILFLGCSIRANTSMHGIEELSVPEYLFDREIEYTIETDPGDVYQKKYIPHKFVGFEQRYDRVKDILSKDDCAVGKVLDADVFLMKAVPLWEKAHDKLCRNPLYFVDRIDA